MIKFKGRYHMKQYIRNKPTKWGFKCFTLCDSESAYICRFEIYTGHQTDPNNEHGATHQVVMRLMEHYLNQGYQQFTDKTLWNKDTALVGTVQAKRRGFPERLKDLKQMKKYGARGDMRYV